MIKAVRTIGVGEAPIVAVRHPPVVPVHHVAVVAINHPAIIPVAAIAIHQPSVVAINHPAIVAITASVEAAIPTTVQAAIPGPIETAIGATVEIGATVGILLMPLGADGAAEISGIVGVATTGDVARAARAGAQPAVAKAGEPVPVRAMARARIGGAARMGAGSAAG